MTEISFTDYWVSLTPDQKKWLAGRLHSSVNALSQMAHSHKRVSRRFAELASIVIGRRVTFPSCCED